MIEYREIPGFPNYYAGSDGEIYSNNFKWKKEGDPLRKLCSGSQVNGYKTVCLPSGEGFRSQRVHVLVCSSFHGPRPLGKECSHLDGNRINNIPENLKWETSSENKLRKNEHGTHDKGCKNSRSVFTEEDVLAVKEMLEKKIPHEYIAKIMDCSRTTVSRIANKQRYL